MNEEMFIIIFIYIIVDEGDTNKGDIGLQREKYKMVKHQLMRV